MGIVTIVRIEFDIDEKICLSKRNGNKHDMRNQLSDGEMSSSKVSFPVDIFSLAEINVAQSVNEKNNNITINVNFSCPSI